MKRRDFLMRAAPLAVAVSTMPLVASAGDLASIDEIMAAMEHGPVVVIIGGVDQSMAQFHNVKNFMEDKPGFQIPVFIVDPESENFHAQPGTLLILRNSYVEAQRIDLVAEDDLQFVFEAVMMNEGGKG